MKFFPYPRLSIIPVILVAISILLSIASLAQAQSPWLNWQNSPPIEDSLVGRIWSVAKMRFISPQQLASQLAHSRYVLIGEVHDNVDHHLLQAWLIEQIAAKATPAIVMEMIAADQSQLLDEYLSGLDAEPAGIGPALDWDKSGWPDWTYYQPIAEVAMRFGLRILPGNPDRKSVRKIARQGINSIDKAEQKRLSLDQTLSASLNEELVQDIKDSHCNLLPQSMVGPMVDVQRFRDARLARAVVDAGAQSKIGAEDSGTGRAILIAGNGHVRSDRGVPWYLIHQQPMATISSVMLLETGGELSKLEELIVTDALGKPAADYFWFTPQAKREDQCEKLRQRFKK